MLQAQLHPRTINRRVFVATEHDAAIARETAMRLRPVTGTQGNVSLHLGNSGNTIVPLPAPAIDLIETVLGAMADRRPISIVPSDNDLTLEQAAKILRVSPRRLLRLLRRGHIPYRMARTHPRILMSDLTAYCDGADNGCRRTFDKIAAMAPNLTVP